MMTTTDKEVQSTEYKVPRRWLRLSLYFVLGTSYFLTSCGDDEDITAPHPKGYFRIDLPKKEYVSYDGDQCPYTFEIPTYSHIERDTNKLSEPCWINVDYTKFKAKLHLSYKVVNNNLRDYLEQSRQLAVQHQVKANAMKESPVMNDSAHVYGLVYEFGGNTASSIQFYLTDTLHHFMRGALYFFARPNSDSIAPVLEYLSKDIYHMIETFRWKDDHLVKFVPPSYEEMKKKNTPHVPNGENNKGLSK